MRINWLLKPKVARVMRSVLLQVHLALGLTLAMIFIVFTQKPLKRMFRGEGALMVGLKEGWHDFFDGMIAGARNMIGIAVATGAAGVIVGTVSLTGAHQVVGEFVLIKSGTKQFSSNSAHQAMVLTA